MNNQCYKRKSKLGLSLIEILVALVVATVLFTVVARAMSSGGKGLATIISNSELLEDTRYAGEIIYSSLQNAVYVYPPQTELRLNRNADYHTENPRTSNSEWLIGSDPIIAMIVAPKTGTTTCPADPNACLTFVAYYTVNRSNVTSNAGLTYAGGSLPFDSANPDALMLFEYRKTLKVSEFAAGVLPPVDHKNTSSAGRLRNVTGRLVADYISPSDGFVIKSISQNSPISCRTGGSLFSRNIDCPDVGETPLALSHENTMLSGRISISGLYNKGRQSYTTPALEFSFSPRNLY